MILVEYSRETQFSAILTLICVIFLFFVASIVLHKAFKMKEKILFWFFINIVFGFSSWYNIVIGYIYWLITKESLSYEFHIIMPLAFYPIGIFAWLYIYTSAIYPKKKKIILILYSLYTLIFEIYLFYFLFFAPNAPVKEFLGQVNELASSPQGFELIFSIVTLIIICGTGFHFSLYSIKNTFNKNTRWKGKFLFIAFTLFLLQLLIDTFSSPTELILIIIGRILLMFTIFFFYLGFILPIWIRKFLALES